MLLEMIASALVPVASEGIKQGLTKWFGGVKPTSIAEVIELDKAEIEKLKALAELDTPVGTPSQWVVDLRASMRYISAAIVIAAGVSTIYLPDLPLDVRTTALEAANIVFGFLFGTRIVSGWQRK